MKMQMREFLVFPAIDDQPVSRQMILSDQTLRGGDEVCQERVAGSRSEKERMAFFGMRMTWKG